MQEIHNASISMLMTIIFFYSVFNAKIHTDFWSMKNLNASLGSTIRNFIKPIFLSNLFLVFFFFFELIFLLI